MQVIFSVTYPQWKGIFTLLFSRWSALVYCPFWLGGCRGERKPLRSPKKEKAFEFFERSGAHCQPLISISPIYFWTTLCEIRPKILLPLVSIISIETVSPTFMKGVFISPSLICSSILFSAKQLEPLAGSSLETVPLPMIDPGCRSRVRATWEIICPKWKCSEKTN